MVGYKLLIVDREKILNDPRLRRLICPFCDHLVREPIALSCGRVCCLSCLRLESNCTPKDGASSVAVWEAGCPVDGQEFLFDEALNTDKRAEEQVMSLAISCFLECGWYGQIMHLETHLKYHRQKEDLKAPSQHNTPQLSDPAPGPSGVSQESSLQEMSGPHGGQSLHDVVQTLLRKQSADHDAIQLLKQQLTLLLGAYNTEKHHREQLQNVVRTIEEKLNVLQIKSVHHIDIGEIKQQLAALGNAVLVGKRDDEQLQEKLTVVEGQVKELQTGDHLDQLKQQLVSLTDSLETEKRHGENLQEEVGAVEAKVEDLGQQLEAVKNGCANAQAECVAERARGIEALNMQGEILQDNISRLQSSVTREQGRQADLEAQFLHLGNGQGL